VTEYIPSYKRGTYTGDLTNRTFLDKTKDEFWMTWMGQMIENEITHRGLYSKKTDETFEVFAPENIAGFEEFAEEFVDVRNKEEMDHIKSIIRRNQSRRRRLDLGGRDILPGLLANAIDPINFVPIPFVKGMSLMKRVTMGGTASAGLIAATEPIRRNYDPTSSDFESAMYIGGGFFFGGLFSGILGKARQGGLDIKSKSQLNPQKLSEGLFSAFHNTETGIDFTKPFTKKFMAEEPDIKFDAAPTNRFVDENGDVITYQQYLTKTSSRLAGRSKSERRVSALKQFKKDNSYQPVAYIEKNGETTVIIDTAFLTKKFRENSHLDKNATLRQNSVPFNIAKLMSNENDYISYLVKKEIYRNRYIQKQKGETRVEYETRLNEKIHEDTLKKINADFTTDTGDLAINKEVLDFLDKFTDSGGIVQTLPKDNPQLSAYVGRKIFELIGDFGVQTRSQDVAMPQSAHLEATTRWEQELHEALETINKAFVEYRTGSTESQFLSGGNLSARAIRAMDTINVYKKTRFGTKETMPSTIKNSFEDFNKAIYDGVVDTTDRIYTDPNTHKSVKKGIDAVRKYYKSYAEAADEVGLFATSKNIANKIEQQNELMSIVDTQIKSVKNAYQKKRLGAIKDRVQDRINRLEKQKDDIDKKFDAPFEMNKNYITRYFNREALLDNPKRFKQILTDWYTTNPRPGVKGTIEERVDATYETILNDSAHMDADGILAMGKRKNNFVAGTRPLMQRSLDIPSDLLEDFLIKDVTDIMKMYKTRMSYAVEITRRFGDRHMEDFLNRLDLDLTLQTVKSSATSSKATKIINHFEDAKDKLYGTFNTDDPTSTNKRIAGFMRNWTSLTSMGRVLYTAQADIGRPFMTHGMSRMWNHWLRPFLTNRDVYQEMVKQAPYLNPAAELTVQGGAMDRYIGSFGTSPRKGGMLDKYLIAPVNNSQGPWFWMNGLTPWTVMMKRFTGYVSQHRFIEDSVKLSQGKLSKQEIKRLASYGIDKKTADVIAKMPWQFTDGIYLPNAQLWSKTGAGRSALQKFRQAIKADIERTIITPSPNDKLNMMYGKIRIDEDSKLYNAFDNEVGRMLGFTKTKYGGAKFGNAFMTLPFQFFSWMIAANRKLLMSGSSGRDFHLVQGATAMVMFGMWGDFLKDPAFWYRKEASEKWLSAVEKSGVLAIYGDLNHILETATKGEMGIRPLFDMEDPYGEPEGHDIFRPFMGAAPFNVLDVYRAFDVGSPKEQADSVRRMIILQNWLVWDRAFKNVYNSAVDY
jgi:hypothetical protein